MDFKQIELDTIQIDLGADEQLSDAYQAIVPEATVPALVLDDGTVLSAVIAIVHYLEERFPTNPYWAAHRRREPIRLTGTTDCSLRFSVPSRTP
jgi:glutathione S-transferase